MAYVTIKLTASHVTPKNVILRAVVATAATSTKIVLREGHANTKNIIVRTNLPNVGGSPTSYTLSCGVGSYTYTGQTATFSVTRVLSGAAGSYTYSGKDATFSVARALSSDTGSYSYSGVSANLLATRVLSSSTGSYAYTGKDASFERTGVLIADTGSYSYTGQTANLVYVPSEVVITPKGGFGDYKFDKREKERLARLRMQQSRLRDDEEALAIILASLTRRD